MQIKKCQTCSNGQTKWNAMPCLNCKGDVTNYKDWSAKEVEKMNYMPDVLKILGVEVGDRFKVYAYDPGDVLEKFWFDRLYVLINENGDRSDEVFLKLIRGEWHIQKLPWKPKYRILYRYVDREGNVEVDYWDNCQIDYYRFNAKNVFKTKEEITPAIIERVLTEMRGGYDND